MSSVDIYLDTSQQNGYLACGIVLLCDTDGTVFRREFGIALGSMTADNAVLSGCTLALASIRPGHYHEQTVVHCKSKLLHEALILGNGGHEQFTTWVQKFQNLWYSIEGNDAEFGRVAELSRVAAVKQQNYDSHPK